MKNFHKTILFTALLSLVSMILASIVQLYGESTLSVKCGYLDPVTIDLLAFSAALFLVIEGAYRIYEHEHAGLRTQFTRSVRVALGLTILTLHVIQFFHK